MGQDFNAAMEKAAADMFLRNQPATQQECCQLAAELAVKFNGVPNDIGSAARGLAEGLFGDVYKQADIGQRQVWDAMCEEAVRAVIASLGSIEIWRP